MIANRRKTRNSHLIDTRNQNQSYGIQCKCTFVCCPDLHYTHVLHVLYTCTCMYIYIVHVYIVLFCREDLTLFEYLSQNHDVR